MKTYEIDLFQPKSRVVALCQKGISMLDDLTLDLLCNFSTGTPLSFGIWGATTVQNGDSFLMIGGFNGVDYLDNVFEYDQDEDQFKQIAALPQGGRCWVSATLVDSDIFPECD